MRTGLVVKLVAVLVLLLGVVLYKMNDFYRQDRLSQADAQIRKQIVGTKTSVSSQISAIRNVVSSYEVDIKENQINWIQLDPFFAIAKLQKQNRGNFSVQQFVARSGTIAASWNASYLEKALAVRPSQSDKPIQARLFKDRAGGKFLVLVFNAQSSQAVAVIGNADYFQKYFDLERGGRMTAALITTDQILAAHSESDYIANMSDETQLSAKKYLLAQEEIAGTNLTAVSYMLKKNVAGSWVIPWSVIGLVAGFGCVLIGLLFYGLEPLERKIERYRKQEREQAFKDIVQSELKEQTVSSASVTGPALMTGPTLEMIEKSKIESVEKAREAFAEPEGELAEATLNGPLQQAIFNLDSLFKHSQITVEKDISTRLNHSFYYSQAIKAFENILRNAIEAVSKKKGQRKIIIRAYDIEREYSVVEIQDNGIGLGELKDDADKIWQPFFTTKPKTHHMGLGLTEALSVFRRCGGDLTLEQVRPEGVIVKMIMRKEKEETVAPQVDFSRPTAQFSEEKTQPGIQTPRPAPAAKQSDDVNEIDLDLDQILSLDELELETAFSSDKINLKDSEPNATPQIREPQFIHTPKTYNVDQIAVTIRRPEKR